MGLQLEGSCGLKALTFSLQRVFPYISAMVNNGSLTYDHSKDGRWTELAGCTAEIRNQNHDTFLAVRYSRGRLTVRCAGSLVPSAGHLVHIQQGGAGGRVVLWQRVVCRIQPPAPLVPKEVLAGQRGSQCSRGDSPCPTGDDRCRRQE